MSFRTGFIRWFKYASFVGDAVLFTLLAAPMTEYIVRGSAPLATSLATHGYAATQVVLFVAILSLAPLTGVAATWALRRRPLHPRAVTAILVGVLAGVATATTVTVGLTQDAGGAWQGYLFLVFASLLGVLPLASVAWAVRDLVRRRHHPTLDLARLVAFAFGLYSLAFGLAGPDFAEALLLNVPAGFAGGIGAVLADRSLIWQARATERSGTPTGHVDFGWIGDDGLGEMLIDQIIDGEKTATCGFKRAYTAQELEEVFSGTGHLRTAGATGAQPRCIIRITEVFETPFGEPDPRLVAGEGDGDDVEKFQADHRIAWESDFPGTAPDDDEILIVELFELVEVLFPAETPAPLSEEPDLRTI